MSVKEKMICSFQRFSQNGIFGRTLGTEKLIAVSQPNMACAETDPVRDQERAAGFMERNKVIGASIAKKFCACVIRVIMT